MMTVYEVPMIIFECFGCGERFPAPMSEAVFVGDVHCPRCDDDDVEVVL